MRDHGMRFTTMAGGEWSEVKPIGGSVSIASDTQITDNWLDFAPAHFAVTLNIASLPWSGGLAFLYEPSNRARQPFELHYERIFGEMSYPRTVRQAKARPKGNRGNRRRTYATITSKTVFYNVTLEDS